MSYKQGKVFFACAFLLMVNVLVFCTNPNPTVAEKTQFEAAFQGRCGHESPCEQLCYELHDGMFECDCRDGFLLHRNGYSCLQLNSTLEPLPGHEDLQLGATFNSREDSLGEDILYERGAMFSAVLEPSGPNTSTSPSSPHSRDWAHAHSLATNQISRPAGPGNDSRVAETPKIKFKSRAGGPTTPGPNLEQKVPGEEPSAGATEAVGVATSTSAPECSLDCGPKGTCIVNSDASSYPGLERCQCPYTKSGAQCKTETEVRWPRFSGQGWLALPPLQAAYKHVQMLIEFRPESWHGILFLTGERDDLAGDFIAILLNQGFIELRFDCGSGVGVVRSDETVKLNQWNKLTVYRHRWNAWIQFNNGKHIQGRSKGLFSRITFREPVFIGGRGNTTGLLDKLPTDYGFRGCIRHFEVNDHVYNFAPQPQGDVVKGFDVEECKADRCSRMPCQHGGKCMVSGQSAVCLCPLGFIGDLCETRLDLQVPSFNGSSYLRYPGMKGRALSWLDMKLVIKPTAEDGVILYNGRRGDGVGDFMAVYISEGRIYFTFDLGTGAATVRSEERVSLGEWHEVVVSRTGRLAVLEVDEGPASHELSPGAFTQLSLPLNLYLGGVPNFDMVSPKVKARTSFQGCIQKVVINDRPLQIFAEALAGVNVDNCQHPCLAKPCGDSARCVPIKESYKCECSYQCEDSNKLTGEISGASFAGTNYFHYSDSNIIHRIVNDKLSINMRFKTYSSSGLLLWSGRSDRGNDFFAVGISGGLLHLRYNLGSGEVFIQYNHTHVNDGHWHRVKIYRDGQVGMISLDNDEMVSGSSIGKLRQLNTNTGLFVGGVDDIEMTTHKKYHRGITGCISDLTLNNDYHVRLSFVEDSSDQCI
nr:PREDICTED: pikachurin-like [Bemisia tabaci]